MSNSNAPFLDQLNKAEKTKSGLYLFPGFLSDPQVFLTRFDSDDDFPWDTKPKLFGERLPQHAYLYDRNKHKSILEKYPVLTHLEDLCKKLEQQFDGIVTSVFCNRFQDPTHHIDWHRDTYGEHIFVLSLGSTRTIEFRRNHSRTKSIIEEDSITPKAGDLYFMPLAINSTHKHRVLRASAEDNAGTRISLVFFFQSPAYAREFKITFRDRMRGAFTSMLE